MPEISVIVPVYKSADTIVRCLESLVAQTMDDIEIILVDDHGGDGSIDAAKAFVSSYRGLKSFVFTATERNSGPGGARNVGIRAAQGKYLSFVDSDDTVGPGFCGSLYRAAEETGADLACCGISVGGRMRENYDVSDRKRFLRHFVSYFTTFLYRRDLIDRWGILFPDSDSAEDTCFLTCCILAASEMTRVQGALYNYILNDDSVSRRSCRDRARRRVSSMRSVVAFAREKGLYGEYRCELRLLMLKKGYGMALKDLIHGILF